MSESPYNEDYFERGIELGISGYTEYHWLPELTIPLAFKMVERFELSRSDSILDFGCAKGYLVKALRLLGRQAYGCDISTYALAQAPPEIKPYLFELDSDDLIPMPVKGTFDWIISKDVLEHVPYDQIDDLLRKLAKATFNAFFAIPLGEDGKYVIPDYEKDVTHIIREPLDWWVERLQAAGFQICCARHRWAGLKDNWAKWREGNGFFIIKTEGANHA